jgi:hypothetical protein
VAKSTIVFRKYHNPIIRNKILDLLSDGLWFLEASGILCLALNLRRNVSQVLIGAVRLELIWLRAVRIWIHFSRHAFIVNATSR